ncbi:Pentatricopeptide repeat-containing protein [Abeliophyllum distichum]|uniref:Pentatricopeptide repeat-containing protein n=1 Tax=Abeliophyllum distichum TaxID=126358 RepID=A0ABD1V3T7_9LAMI
MIQPTSTGQLRDIDLPLKCQRNGRIPPRDVNSHVLSWLVILYANFKMTPEAIQVFEHMRVCGFKPHLHACTVLLNVLVKERVNDIDEALHLRDVMEAKGLYPGVVTYNAILRKLCEEGRIKDANKLLLEMSEKKI